MSKGSYDLNVARGSDWLSRDVYSSIKNEVSKWPSWKQSAYGVGNGGGSGSQKPSSSSNV